MTSSTVLRVILAVVVLQVAAGQVINLKTKLADNHNWLEGGVVHISPHETVSVASSGTFVRPVVFLSAPLAGAIDTPSTVPVQAKVKSFLYNNNSTMSFDIELIWPSNETCTSGWYDSTSLKGTFAVGWYIGESGAYNVSGIQMEFLTVSVNAQEFTQSGWIYPFGKSCTYPSQSGDNDYAPGAMFTIQTDNNPGMFLTVRSSAWYKTSSTGCNYGWNQGSFRLFPHEYESGGMNLTKIKSEDVGVFLFDSRVPLSMDCLVGTYIELGEINQLNHVAHMLPTHKRFDTRISSTGTAVFGSAISFTNQDPFSIQAFSSESAVNDIYVSLQEDQCMDKEVRHEYEALPFLISTHSSCSSAVPVVTEQSNAHPTTLPSTSPSTSPSLPSEDGGNTDETHSPSQTPTSSSLAPTLSELSDNSESNFPADNESSILLAVLVPISFIFIVAVAGFFTKNYLLAGRKDEDDYDGLGLLNSSTHSSTSLGVEI